MSRKFLFRERSRMASELLKSSEDVPSKESGGVEFNRSADDENNLSRVIEISTAKISWSCNLVVSASLSTLIT